MTLPGWSGETTAFIAAPAEVMHMYEVEVKVPADLDTVRARARDLGATPIETVLQEDRYYDAPHRSFGETDEALRIRREEPLDEGGRTRSAEARTRLTYKGPLVDERSKTREEVETAVDDAEALDAIFQNLGFEPAVTVRKERESYRYEGYTITLDTVADVGEYVVVETTATEADREAASDGAFEVIEALGLDPGASIQTSYLHLLLQK